MEFTDTPLAPDYARVFASGVHVAGGVGLGNSCLRSRLPDAGPSPAEGKVQRVRP